MGQALYRKYRSKKLSEIVGQDHITDTLERALKKGKISHAYLFTGPRGVGKTSIARILAHEINELPYTDESVHLDIIEIDAASNRRIDEIRDLREKVHIAPTSAKYKVYIIDEVHMLTKEAFNALLKTLEEPPAHVIFILATTEVHKLPETIISRTQRFTFKSVDEDSIAKHLRTLAESEGMKIDDEAIKLLAEQGHGSFRDSISLLDQVGNSKNKVSREDAEKIVGIAQSKHISDLEKAVIHGSPADIVNVLDAMTEDGTNPAQAAKQLALNLRKIIIDGNGNLEITKLLHDLLLVQTSPHSSSQLEIALFKANLSFNPNTKPQESDKFFEQLPVEKTIIKKPKIPPIQSQQSNIAPLMEWWGDVLTHIKQVNNTLYGILRMADASLDGKTINLRFGFNFHSKKVTDAATQLKIREAIKAITGEEYAVVALHDASLGKKSEPFPSAIATDKNINNEDLDSITNIFGGGEVLES